VLRIRCSQAPSFLSIWFSFIGQIFMMSTFCVPGTVLLLGTQYWRIQPRDLPHVIPVYLKSFSHQILKISSSLRSIADFKIFYPVWLLIFYLWSGWPESFQRLFILGCGLCIWSYSLYACHMCYCERLCECCEVREHLYAARFDLSLIVPHHRAS
jgi:hypothetical protein